MSDLHVGDVTVAIVLEKLRKREWQVPRFQREFVWSVPNVIDLLISIFEAHPIGMATLWEQSSPPELDLDPISVLDYDPVGKGKTLRVFSRVDAAPPKTFAILDGRQRCTAIAMAFGGLRALDGKFKYAGRYYLNVLSDDPANRVVFKKETEVKRDTLTADANCIARGLFPLTSNIEGEEILPQWMRYIQAIRNPSFYKDGKVPGDNELERRDQILKQAFEGIVGTKLAVYTVPESYHLADICEIFETLNTTGTKVSTVDLIHSWLYSDTSQDVEGAVELRSWIDDLGQREGAIGWASSDDRPELVSQIVTSCYIALVTRPEPRHVSGSRGTSISSIKAGDLLATPTDHWKAVIQNESLLAEFLGDFQRVVAGGYFPYSASPYPVLAALYVALRWHLHFDGAPNGSWGRRELDAIFPAFYWRNALTNRYDQGILTKVGADIKDLKAWLGLRKDYGSITEWGAAVQDQVSEGLKSALPSRDQLIEWLTSGRQTGALQKALTLVMLAKAKNDLVDPSIQLAFPNAESVELHHIFPKAWCRNSRGGGLENLLDPEKAGKDWVESTANLMPLSRKSNNTWKARLPGQVLLDKKITFEQVQEILRDLFIDQTAFDLLLKGAAGIQQFWEHRAALIADDLLRRTWVKV